mgnify:CR=1 FL=1
MRILIVDDSRSMREIIKNSLSSIEGVEIHAAPNGAEAETILQELALDGKTIDVMFLDWMMPEFTGLELLQSLNGASAFPKPGIVMLTAETYPDQVEACLKYGVSTYVTKPFTKETLLNAAAKAYAERTLKHAV